MTRVINYTITYVLVPQGAGNVTVGAAEVAVEGTTYRTKPLAIEVVDEGKAPGGGGSAAGGQPQRREEASSESAAQSPGRQGRHPVAAIVSRTSVFKGEPLRVTFKLYERVPIVGYNDVKFPSFNGFWAQDLNTETPAANAKPSTEKSTRRSWPRSTCSIRSRPVRSSSSLPRSPPWRRSSSRAAAASILSSGAGTIS